MIKLLNPKATNQLIVNRFWSFALVISVLTIKGKADSYLW